ncbi:MAG TPA: sugar phosphate nucleotidyltransferase, partial [bacterium]|nr:sugar phosphate nucleotidyltransferase [bacterium]
MKSIVLTAGYGTRLEPLTDNRSKAMIEICGQPLLSRLLRAMSEIGFNETAVVVNPKHSRMVVDFSSLPPGDLPAVTWFEQISGHGVGHGVLAASDYIESQDYFLLCYGDIMFNGNMLQSLLNSFNAIRKPVASVCLTGDSSDFGVIYMDQEMRIHEIIEKPQERKLGNYILAGAFILPGTFLELISECGGSMIDAFKRFIQDAEMYASIWEHDWIDIAYPWSVLAANQMLMREWHQSIQSTSITIESGVNISGPVIIEDNVIIKSGASIIGPCFIGKNSFIGHNVLLRECTSIGAGSTIGFGVEIKNSVIMAHSEIGRLSFIGDSV